MIKLSNRPFWQTPMAPALLVLLIAILGRFSTGFGMLLIGIMAVATLLVMAACLMALNHIANIPGGRSENRIGIALIAASIVLFFVSDALRDQTRFMLWSSTHRRVLQQSTHHDGLVPQWPGTTNSDGSVRVLAVDTRDALSVPAGAEAWRGRTGWPCRIVMARRMTDRVYIVTGDHCLLPGFDQ